MFAKIVPCIIFASSLRLIFFKWSSLSCIILFPIQIESTQNIQILCWKYNTKKMWVVSAKNIPLETSKKSQSANIRDYPTLNKYFIAEYRIGWVHRVGIMDFFHLKCNFFLGINTLLGWIMTMSRPKIIRIWWFLNEFQHR